MAERKYSIGRPLQEVRLRNWKGGQVAQMKKAIEILEGELNNAMAAQTNQGAKRVVSNRIPKVTGLSVTAGFKSFQISFNPAKGIQDLLFYEIQKDNTSSFADPVTFTIPQTTITIPTTVEHELVFVRVRVMDSKFRVGPWSATDSATGSSNFRINSTRGERTTLEIAEADFDTWVDVQTITVPTTVAAISVSVSPGVNARMTEERSPPPPIRRFQTFYDVTFRLLRDGAEFTNAGKCRIIGHSTYRNDGGEGGAGEEKEEQGIFGVIISPLVTYTNSEVVTFTVQALVDSVNTISLDQDGNPVTLIDDPFIIIDNFDVLEVIQVT